MSSQKDGFLERWVPERWAIFGSVQIRPRKISFWEAKDDFSYTLGGIPYAVAYCQACFDLQGNGDLLDIL